MIFTINEHYTTKEFTQQASEFFNSQGQIQLQDIFDESTFSAFRNELIETKKLFSQKSNPLIYSFDELISDVPVGVLNGVEYLKSKQFQEYIESILGFSLDFQELTIRKFKHKSYELIHDSKITDSLLIDVYLFLTIDEFDENTGGQKVYTTFDEELLYLTPQDNVLTCVFRDEQLRQYTKYINSFAKDKQYIEVKLTYEISVEDEMI